MWWLTMPAESAAIVSHHIVGERHQIDLARHHVGLDLDRPGCRLFEPEIDAGEIAGGNRAPGERGARPGLGDLALGIEEFHRDKARDAIAGQRELALPDGFAAATAILRALPQHTDPAAEAADGKRRD